MILPLLKTWDIEVGNIIQIFGTDITIIEHELGFENTDKHVDTKIVISVNGNRLVLHAYNSTQNLMVQGKYHENFAINCLKPLLDTKIKESSEQIMKINNDINPIPRGI